MKRFLLLAALLLMGGLFCSCTVEVHFASPQQSAASETQTAAQIEPAQTSASDAAGEQNEIRAAWVSYTELNPKRLRSEADFQAHVKTLLAPLTALSVTDVFLQVRPFADAIYPSALFAPSSCVVRRRGDTLPFDFLAVFLSQAKEAHLRVHAWINPYRVSTSAGDEAAFQSDPAVGALLKKKGAPCVLPWNGGVYLDPASEDVQTLIVNGVKELLETYELSGVHLDDYFYPTADAAFDSGSFAAYQKEGGKADLLSFRRENVSRLMQRLYKAVKSFGSDKVLSVSPSADIEKNETVFGADVRRWGREAGFCDWLIPQLYFGFLHETRPFVRCAEAWKALCKNKSVRLLGGLAAYKIGKSDAFAGAGAEEWTHAKTILGDQVLALRKAGFGGFALFSASFLRFDKKLCATVLKNLKDVL